MNSLKPLVKRLFFVLLAGTSLSNAFCQSPLPYIQNFENLSASKVYNKSTSNISDLEHWQLDVQIAGRLSVIEDDPYLIAGNNSIALDNQLSNGRGGASLYLTLDLSMHTKDQLELTFKYQSFEYPNPKDTFDYISIRGDSSENWIHVYHWSSKEINETRLVAIDIDEELQKNQQSPGSTFQVRFHASTQRSLKYGGGIVIDDVVLTQKPENNAEIVGFRPACKGLSSITALLYNDGYVDINKASIDWWFDGKKQTPANYTGFLKPGDTQLVTLGQKEISSRHLVSAVSTKVNGQADSLAIDTTGATIYPSLGGTYTVGLNGNYQYLDSALNSLSRNGMCGNVTLSLLSDTVYGPIKIEDIPSLDETFTLSIIGKNSNKTVVLKPSSSSEFLLGIFSSQTVVLQNLHFHLIAEKQQYGVGISGAKIQNLNSVLINNCSFSAIRDASLEYQFTLFISGRTLGSVEINSCDFEASLLAEINVDGFNQKHARLFKFTNNQLNSVKLTTLSFNRVVIENNDVTGYLHARFAKSAVLNSNIVNSDQTGLRIEGSYGFRPTISLINNMIWAKREAIKLSQIGEGDLWHNSIKSTTPLLLEQCASLDIRNNIIASAGNQILKIYSNSSPFEICENNVIYGKGSYPFYTSKMRYSSLEQFRNYDTLSIGLNYSLQPRFKNDSSLFLHKDSFMHAGSFLNSVKYDIEGEPRCRLAPTIGADEIALRSKSRLSFSIPREVFANEEFLIESKEKKNPYANYILKINNQLIDTIGYSTRLKINTVGVQKITLVGITCSQSDSISQNIIVKKVTLKPLASFIANKRYVNVGDTVRLINTTKNGADSFFWDITPKVFLNDSLELKPVYEFIAGTSVNSKNPILVVKGSGAFDVCLTAQNIQGMASKCNDSVFIARKFYWLCDFLVTNEKHGQLHSPPSSFPGSGFKCLMTINTCHDSLQLSFNQFELYNRARLKIFAGKDTLGQPIHNYHSNYKDGLVGSISDKSFMKSIIAKGGNLTIMLTVKPSNGFSNWGSFNFNWDALTETKNQKLTVQVDLPDTLCTSSLMQVKPSSNLTLERIKWTINSQQTGKYSFDAPELYEEFQQEGEITITMDAYSCFDSASFSKKIYVVSPDAPPTARMYVSETKPKVLSTVRLIDSSFVSSYACSDYTQWRIEPNTYKLLHGTTLNSKLVDVQFLEKGCYNITLVSQNILGSDSITRNCAVNVDDQTIGHHENLSLESSAYPNPFKNVLNIQLGGIENRRVQIINAQGKTIHEQNGTGTLQLTTDSWKNGLYLIYIVEGSGIIRVHKAIKE